MRARRCFFFSLFSALFGRPLAATIDLQVELMTKMTNPWGAQVREIMREMERDREGEQETKTKSRNTIARKHTLHCVSAVLSLCLSFLVEAFASRRDATFMQHQAVISFWARELLVRCWHDAPSSDRCCHPDSAARPPTRQELSAQATEGPDPCWERDPNLALSTAPITGADLIVSLLGKNKLKGMAAPPRSRSEFETMSPTLVLIISASSFVFSQIVKTECAHEWLVETE